ncbi:MAG: hypothetical protein NC328_04300 [Muribaculum sp.]|nr:hypothetical protein [Muribaculum sp.]
MRRTLRRMNSNMCGLLRIYGVAMALFMVTMFTGCIHHPTDSRQSRAHALYLEETALLRQYIDSMKLAPDSLTAEKLLDACRDRMESLNFKYPVDTDLEMTEGENDTIAILTVRMMSIHDKKLNVRDTVVHE